MRNGTGLARGEQKGSGAGVIIRQKRIEQNISQEYLAEQLGVSRQSISKWENGQSEPATKKLVQLAEILNMEVSELLSASSREKEEKKPGFLVGVEVRAEDLDSLRRFFCEMPEDLYDNYNTSFLVFCQASGRERARIKRTLEQMLSRQVEVLSYGEALGENGVYLLWDKKRSEEGFFRMIARRRGPDAVGVLLSGGRDGFVDELQELKDCGALLLVREPDGTPGDAGRAAAAQTGICDYIVSAEKMGSRIGGYIRRRFHERAQKYPDMQDEELFERILDCLARNMRIRFGDYRDELVARGMVCRLEQNPFDTVDAYARYLEASSEEQHLLAETILGIVGGGRFAAEEILKLQPLIARMHPEEKGFRAWITGCRDGLEAYTLVMLLDELTAGDAEEDKIKIFATDAEGRTIDMAEQGIYPSERLNGLPDKWISRYFEKAAEGWQVVRSIRNRVIFSIHDLLINPPFAKLDLLICRGILKNLKPQKKKNAAARLSYALKVGACLVLGKGEDARELGEWFREESGFSCVYRKIQASSVSFGQLVTPYPAAVGQEEPFSMTKVMETLLMAGIPSGIIFNDKLEILYTGQDAGDYLKFRSGRFTRDLFENLQQELGAYVEMLLKQMRREGRERIESRITVETEGGSQTLKLFLLCRLIIGREYYLLWFEREDIRKGQAENPAAELEIRQLEQELSTAKGNLCQALQELDETKSRYDLLNEEFQSSNEELALINGELQSSNFELETSNRELLRVNAEYQQKISEFSKEQPTGEEVLEAMGLEAIWLDEELCIRQMTGGIARLTNLRSFDTGRFAGGLVLMDNYMQWKQDLQEIQDNKKEIRRSIAMKSGKKAEIRLIPRKSSATGEYGCLVIVQAGDTKEEG